MAPQIWARCGRREIKRLGIEGAKCCHNLLEVAITLSITAQNCGVNLIFTRGHISLAVAFKGPDAILGLYKCNYFLTRGEELGAAAG